MPAIHEHSPPPWMRSGGHFHIAFMGRRDKPGDDEGDKRRLPALIGLLFRSALSFLAFDELEGCLKHLVGVVVPTRAYKRVDKVAFGLR